MTQKSYVWGGTTTGDATLAPYSHEEWALLWSLLFTYRRIAEGVIPSDHSDYPGNLWVSNPATSTVRVSAGVGIVNGKLYTNDANVDTDLNGSGTGYYRVVLRSTISTQQVRIAFLGPTPGMAPGTTQTSSVWEISLATLYFDDGTNTVSNIVDLRNQIAPVKHHWRQGGSVSIWSTAGTVNYNSQVAKMQSGVVSVAFSTQSTRTVAVSFPLAWSYAPIVMVSVASVANRLFAVANNVTTAGFDFVFRTDDLGNISETVTGNWIALGPI